MNPRNKKFIDLLCDLIRLRPVSSDLCAIRKVAERLHDFLEKLGLHCSIETIDGRSGLYVSTMPGKVQDVLFSAHLDVVPAINGEQFEPYIEKNMLYGRGAADCLGNVTAIAIALAAAKERSLSASALFNGDEETGGLTLPRILRRGFGARKAVIVSDHYEFDKITCGQKGILILKLVATGKGGHAAYVMDKERNPLDILARAYLDLRAGWTNPSSPGDWRDSVNGTIVSGGNAVNQIPDKAELTLNIRYVEPGSREAIVERVRKLTGGLAAIETIRFCEPVAPSLQTGVVDLLRRSCEKIYKRPFGFSKMCGATDARHLTGLGVPIAITGIAGGGAHSSEEFAELESIDSCADVFLDFIERCEHDIH